MEWETREYIMHSTLERVMNKRVWSTGVILCACVCVLGQAGGKGGGGGGLQPPYSPPSDSHTFLVAPVHLYGSPPPICPWLQL